jgi:hypothetical protein
MNARSNPSRTTATIIGYRHSCDELEAENQALIVQIQELRARLCGRIPPAFAPLGSLHSTEGNIRVTAGRLRVP